MSRDVHVWVDTLDWLSAFSAKGDNVHDFPWKKCVLSNKRICFQGVGEGGKVDFF